MIFLFSEYQEVELHTANKSKDKACTFPSYSSYYMAVVNEPVETVDVSYENVLYEKYISEYGNVAQIDEKQVHTSYEFI